MISQLRDTSLLFNFWKTILKAPYCFEVTQQRWEECMFNDIDKHGNKLFKEINTYVSYYENDIVGFIQFGWSAIGFDENGEISTQISYPIIRNFYFKEGHDNEGNELIKYALDFFNTENKVKIYAFFHYFGMSCCASHGKLHEEYNYIESVLIDFGFIKEHENVYYTKKLSETDLVKESSEILLKYQPISKNNLQCIDFFHNERKIGGCELFYLPQVKTVYLNWIYIYKSEKCKGFGTICMRQLFSELYVKGIKILDTDTADNNIIAQNYYLKNSFVDRGRTRSYIK